MYRSSLQKVPKHFKITLAFFAPLNHAGVIPRTETKICTAYRLSVNPSGLGGLLTLDNPATVPRRILVGIWWALFVFRPLGCHSIERGLAVDYYFLLLYYDYRTASSRPGY